LFAFRFRTGNTINAGFLRIGVRRPGWFRLARRLRHIPAQAAGTYYTDALCFDIEIELADDGPQSSRLRSGQAQ
jgi:hypothetical protein